MIYDPEANIMSLELTKDPIVNAKEFGNFIIHFSKTGKPVLIEILDASKLVGQFDKVKDKGRLKRIQPVPEA
ncbi:MAG: hypothetical protein UT64_C0017G0004 [Candidatus Falkowbacteria bacterium GW2011_GWF2_39_8]|uniref:DUF2283 domain-containing protein n=1 Tax=Candidatus Falkowbacteria bacterium GW2011_GWF2_39_8 TaxID=1618642 RepID=A0A0G0Q6K3_9BACT|nr:MAG: hypothetical protein UT64_C0017G0004 [Candidatus Falkowbacteria bacterium GW2011_GWF2_39_8]